LEDFNLGLGWESPDDGSGHWSDAMHVAQPLEDYQGGSFAGTFIGNFMILSWAFPGHFL